MQRGEPAGIGLVHISTVVGQLVDYSILPIVAGQVEGRVSIHVDFINLQMSPTWVIKSTEANVLHFPPKAYRLCWRKEIPICQCDHSELTLAPAWSSWEGFSRGGKAQQNVKVTKSELGGRVRGFHLWQAIFPLGKGQKGRGKAASKRQRRTESGEQETSPDLNSEQKRKGWEVLRELLGGLNSEPALLTPQEATFWWLGCGAALVI